MAEPTDTGRTPSEDPELAALAKRLRPDELLWDRYRLARRLGTGGFGVVWLAQDEALHMQVALKLLADSIVHSPDALDDLKRETRLSLRLTHPSIVRIYGFHSDEELAAISMEFVDGGTLSSLRRRKPDRVFEADELEGIVRELCVALDYAHSEVRIVHRDLKPGNLMLNRVGRLKVTDFGISSTISETRSRLSMRRSSAGTPAYMSPQQMLGQTPTVADDIYALGATLFDLLTGKPPFYQGDIAEQVKSVPAPGVNARREAFAVRPTVPSAWEEAIARCLRKEASERPPSALAVLEMLALEGGEDTAQRTRLVTPAPEPEESGPPLGVAADATREEEPTHGSAPTRTSEGAPGEEGPEPAPSPGEREPGPLPSSSGESEPAERIARDTARRRPHGRRAPLGLGVGLIAVLVIGFALLRPLFRGGNTEPTVPVADRVAPTPDPHQDRGEEPNATAFEARLRAADWAGAAAVLDTRERTGSDVTAARAQLDAARAARASDIEALERALAAGDVTGARRTLEALATHAPEDTQLSDLAARVEDAAGDQLRLERAVRAALDAEDGVAAGAAVDAYAARFPRSPELAAWRETIDTWASDAAGAASDAAYANDARVFETAIASGDLERARAVLGRLRAVRPEDPADAARARRLADATSLRDALDTFERALAAADPDLDAAQRALEAAERLRPGDAANTRLATRLADARRDEGDRLAREIARAIDGGELERAMRLLARLRELQPAHAQLTALESDLDGAHWDAEIRAVIARYESTKETLNADGYADLFADPTAVRDRTRAAFADLESQRIDIDHVEITRDGEHASVSFHERVTYKARSGAAAEGEQRLTLDLVHRDGRWLIERQTRQR